MKKIFIECRYEGEIKIPQNLIEMMPNEVALFASVQFIGLLDEAKKQLEKNGKKVLLFRPKHCKYPGQLLGCSNEKFHAKSFLYIGDGEFHPLALLFRNDAPVFNYNPKSNKHFLLKKNFLEDFDKKNKGALLKFLSSENIGVIISTKPGQLDIKGAEKLSSRHPEKKFYFFISDYLDLKSLEDFNFVDVFVNTACPRIIDDAGKMNKPLINLCDLDILLGKDAEE